MKDDAAAEVVGVILIVAITVVVAALVAAFALGMGSSIKKPYQAYFTIDRSNMYNDVTITNVGGANLALLTDPIKISYTNAAGVQTSYDTPVNIIASSGGLASGNLNNKSATQLVLSHSMINPDGKCHIVIVGTFMDGSQQVLLQADT